MCQLTIPCHRLPPLILLLDLGKQDLQVFVWGAWIHAVMCHVSQGGTKEALVGSEIFTMQRVRDVRRDPKPWDVFVDTVQIWVSEFVGLVRMWISILHHHVHRSMAMWSSWQGKNYKD